MLTGVNGAVESPVGENPENEAAVNAPQVSCVETPHSPLSGEVAFTLDFSALHEQALVSSSDAGQLAPKPEEVNALAHLFDFADHAARQIEAPEQQYAWSNIEAAESSQLAQLDWLEMADRDADGGVNEDSMYTVCAFFKYFSDACIGSFFAKGRLKAILDRVEFSQKVLSDLGIISASLDVVPDDFAEFLTQLKAYFDQYTLKRDRRFSSALDIDYSKLAEERYAIPMLESQPESGGGDDNSSSVKSSKSVDLYGATTLPNLVLGAERAVTEMAAAAA